MLRSKFAIYDMDVDSTSLNCHYNKLLVISTHNDISTVYHLIFKYYEKTIHVPEQP